MQCLKVIVAENTYMVVAGAASLKIIMLSMYSEEQYAIRSLRNGASAYLTKANATDELIKDREAAASGKRYITPSAAENRHVPRLPVGKDAFGYQRPAHQVRCPA